MIAYDNRWARLIKDVLFVALGLWLAGRHHILAVIVGLLAAFWYGRDAYYQAKVLWQEKHYQAPPRPESNDSKITTSNLDDAKEVDFEKE